MALIETFGGKRIMDFTRQDSICGALLLAFNKKLKYDYYIPRIYVLESMLKRDIAKVEIAKDFKSEILELIICYGDGDSYIGRYLSQEYRFRNEWFFGWGDLYTWRQGQKKRDVEFSNKYLSKDEMVEIEKIWKVLRQSIVEYAKTTEI